MYANTLNRLRNGRRADDGFTLIELLIVIVILGILAAIVVFSVRGITDRGEDAACDTSKKTVETAYEAYIAQDPQGDEPTQWSDLVPAFIHSQPAGVTVDWATGNVTGNC